MLSSQYVLNTDGVAQCGICRGRLVLDPNIEETVCSACGVVYEDPSTYHSHLLGSISPQIEGERTVGEPGSSMLYDINLPTVIGSANVDVRGQALKESFDMDRLRKLNNVTLQDPERKSLLQAIDTIRRITETMHLGSGVAERAYRIYRKCNVGGSSRRKAIVSAAVASVYLACKELGVARSTREIQNAIREIRPRGVRHYSNFITNQLNLSDNTPGASSFVGRIAAKAGLSGKTERKSIEVLSQVKDNLILIGKKPVPLAAAALYLASTFTGEHTTLLKIAFAAEVTPMTVRKRSLDISQILAGTGLGA